MHRLKSEVLGQLPPKTEQLDASAMTAAQQAAYDALLHAHVMRQLARNPSAAVRAPAAFVARADRGGGSRDTPLNVAESDDEQPLSAVMASRSSPANKPAATAAAAAALASPSRRGSPRAASSATARAGAAPSKARATAKGKATAKEPAQRGANSYSPRGDSSLAERAKSAAALRRVAARSDSSALVGTDTDAARNLFVQLRKAANHPLLLRRHFDDAATLARIARTLYSAHHFGKAATLEMVEREVAQYNDFDLHQLCHEHDAELGDLVLEEARRCAVPPLSPCRVLTPNSFALARSQDDLFSPSAKFTRLRELLPALAADGHRVLLFSQWVRLLDLLELLLERLDLGFLRLDGSTPVQERHALVTEFQRDPSVKVFLLSTRAGGLGINLTAADTVILHDSDFNPEIDRQAIDRAHRIGQERPVTVYRLVCSATVDEKITLIANRKRHMNAALMDGDDASAGGGGDDADGDDNAAPEASAVTNILADAVSAYLRGTAEEAE